PGSVEEEKSRLPARGAARNERGGGGAPPPFLPYAQGNFPTPSGKAELSAESLKSKGLHPVAAFVAPEESRHSPRAAEFPLELLARKAENFLNSTFSNIPSVQSWEETDLLEMNLTDAERRGIHDGETVRVFN